MRAQARYVRCSARKARLVLEHIRGKPAVEARSILAFQPRAAARDAGKVLASAIANAENNAGHDEDDLIVWAAYADEGPTLKRWRARARGRVNRIRKRTCHITITLAVAEPGEIKRRPVRPAPEPEPEARSPSRAASRGPRSPPPRRPPRPPRSRSPRLRRSPSPSRPSPRLPSPRPSPRPPSRSPTPRPTRRPPKMGHKVHPGGLRVGVIHTWKSNWFTSKKEFAGALLEDVHIRDHIYGKLAHAGLSDIHIRKDKQRVTVDIYTARPGIVIGKSGSEVDALRRELHDMTGKNVQVNITEIKRPELDAKLVAQSIAEQLQNRVSFRRAMKRSLSSSMRSGAQGVKVRCGGRLGGSEMSRSEQYSEGRVPLHTLRADIDYGFAEAKTTFGRIGVKVWINKGEIMPEGFERDGGAARLGEVDARRRRRGALPGELEQLGPTRPGRREGGGRGRRPRPGGRRRTAVAAVAAAVLAVRGGGPMPRPSSRPRRPRRRPTRRLRRPRLLHPRPRAPRDPGPGGERVVLLPKRTKYRRVHRGRRAGL